MNCKLFSQELSTKELYESFVCRFNPAQELCPTCGAKGECKVFAYYTRNVIDIIDGCVVYQTVRIIRVLCSCGHSHAILPDILVPYKQYSLPFILHILKIYLEHSISLSKIYETFGIAHTVLYRWLFDFSKHKAIWLGRSGTKENSSMSFLNQLSEKAPFSDFTFGFYRLTLLSFLQTHVNPANCCSLPPG